MNPSEAMYLLAAQADPSTVLICCVAIGLIVAAVSVAAMKSQMKPVAQTATAVSSLLRETFRLTRKDEHYVRTDLTRTPRPKPQQPGQPGRP